MKTQSEKSDMNLFRANISILVYGTVSLAAGIACLFIIDPKYNVQLLAVVFGAFGLFYLLTYLIARVCIDPEKITCRSHFGTTKSIPWNELKDFDEEDIHTSPFRAAIKLHGQKSDIIIYSYIERIGRIKELIKEKKPDVFSY